MSRRGKRVGRDTLCQAVCRRRTILVVKAMIVNLILIYSEQILLYRIIDSEHCPYGGKEGSLLAESAFFELRLGIFCDFELTVLQFVTI